MSNPNELHQNISTDELKRMLQEREAQEQEGVKSVDDFLNEQADEVVETPTEESTDERIFNLHHEVVETPKPLEHLRFDMPTPVDDTHVTSTPVEEKPEAPVVIEPTDSKVDVFDLKHLTELAESTPPLNPFVEPSPTPKETNDTRKDKPELSNTQKAQNIVKRLDPKTDKSTLSVWVPRVGDDSEYKAPSKLVERSEEHPTFKNRRFLQLKNQADMEHVINSLSLPPDNAENTLRMVNSNAAFMDGEDQMNALKVASLTGGLKGTYGEDIFVSGAIKDEKVNISRGFEIPGVKEPINSRRTTMNVGDGAVSGIAARVVMSNAIGIGSFRTVILPSSGIVAVIGSPTVEELYDMQTMLDQSKINLGRNTGGATYGTTTWFINSKIVELFAKKIIYCNLPNHSLELLNKMINVMDIPTIAWQLAASIYPDGYRYNRTVMSADGRTEIVLGDLRLDDCQFTLDSRLSTRQKQHLFNGGTKRTTIEELESYARNWVHPDEVEKHEYQISTREYIENNVRYKAETFVVLDTPNLETYYEHGSSWDVYLTDSVNQVLKMISDERTRSEFLANKTMATSLREYSPYIKSVLIKTTNLDSGNTSVKSVSDVSDIIDYLDVISTNVEMSEKLREHIVTFINKMTKVVYGVPVADDLEETSPVSDAIVPMNPVAIFFTLTEQTYLKLLQMREA